MEFEGNGYMGWLNWALGFGVGSVAWCSGYEALALGFLLLAWDMGHGRRDLINTINRVRRLDFMLFLD